MKKTLVFISKAIGLLLLISLGLFLSVFSFLFIKGKMASIKNNDLLGQQPPTLSLDNYTFRDLNKNGLLDPYEDSRLDLETRVEDLTSQMNMEEKAGLMFITMISMNNDGTVTETPSLKNPFSFILEASSNMIANKKMNHFNILQSPSAESMINWNNNIQKMAERTRLGIPVTIASDPRHGVPNTPGASIVTPFYSKWCSALGFAAIGDSVLMREFGNIARQEYLATGIRLALSPMADLATEPRWARMNGTFGEDAELSAKMTKAYILGFQGDSITSSSVECMAKHFSGGGPQEDGLDAHFPPGGQVYPGDNFDYHLIPFEKGVFSANAAQIMPYYGIPKGQTTEDVGFGYNKDIITGLLRNKYHFDGIVCTDWGLVSGMKILGMAFKPASAHGVEHLNKSERVAKIMDAGCDMFGGEAIPEEIIKLVASGELSKDRINISVKRILREKFKLGLFDNPFLTSEMVEKIGTPEFMAKGLESQRRSLVLLKNQEQTLPLKSTKKVYLHGFEDGDQAFLENTVSNPKEADLIIMKISTPFRPKKDYLMERAFHQGRLDFTDKEKAILLKLITLKPTITVINLERAAVIPEINSATKGLIADFGSSNEVILDLIFGKFSPEGKLPFELPSSMTAVENQKEDLPYDSENPLYEFGAGLTY